MDILVIERVYGMEKHEKTVKYIAYDAKTIRLIFYRSDKW